MTSDARVRRGFTLIELLVAIVIITILVSILIPVIGKVREAAFVTNSAALIQSLEGAIEQYQQTFNAYPGPLSDDQLGPTPPIAPSANNLPEVVGQSVTGTENLVLGLLGGLKVTNTGTPAIPVWVFNFDWTLVGSGPRRLKDPPQHYQSFIDSKDLSWSDGQPNGATNGPGLISGLYADDITPSRATAAGAVDSVIPEFVDRFPHPMPILYLRAKVGAPSVISFRGGTQYDIAQILAYTDPTGTFNNGQFPPTATASIGLGKKMTEYYAGSATPVKTTTPFHGLRTIDPAPGSATSRNMTTPGNGYYMPADAFPYFQNPGMPGTPRSKDKYILISAGKDRIYGTEDDITSFGPVLPSQ